MNKWEIAPTKLNLLITKDRLEFIKEGKELLENKKEVLMMHLLSIVAQIRKLREKVDEQLKQAYQYLDVAIKVMGRDEFYNISSSIKEYTEVDIIYKHIMGVIVPELRIKSIPPKPSTAMFHTPIEFEKALKIARDILEEIIKLIELDATMWKLVEEIKRTMKRINALENIVIPQLEEIVKFIADSLEERSRESLFQMKRIKAKRIKENI